MSGGRSDELRRLSRQHWAQDRPQDAFEAAWAAFDLDPDRRVKALLARLLEDYPAALQPGRRADYLKLLTDREVEPDLISTAGWQLLLHSRVLADGAPDSDFAALAFDLTRDELVLALLRESPVYFAPAERLLTGLRRWLLSSGEWRQHPEIIAALTRQMQLNGGAWPFDEVERTQFAKAECSSMASAYVPVRAPRTKAIAANARDPVTGRVTAQYEGWPYPAWTRITVGEPSSLPDVIREIDGKLAETLPVAADMLVAGCGTGRQAAYIARRFPDAAITAIDVSEASLDYARRQCGVLGIENVRFLKLDLHDVAQLGQHFHAIHCGGVLHHLPSPERGLKVLAGVLHRGSVMHIMVYNRLQRLMVAAAQTLINDLIQHPVNDDLLRRVRQRILQKGQNPPASYVIWMNDFGTLPGAHDLLLHRHEDPFDVTRVEHALDLAGLRLLSFEMRSPVVRARYDAMAPEDTKHQDFKSWSRFARSDPFATVSHFRFWCRKKPA